MRSLGLSLVLVVIAAVMGIGWLITEIDFRTSGVDLSRNAEVAAYERMVRDMALTLDALPDRREFLAGWQQQGELRATLGSLAGFPVPAELRANFEAGQPLVLESEGKLSIHAYLPHSAEVLSLIVPEDVVLGTQIRPSLILTLLFYVGVVAAILLWLYPLVQRLLVLRRAAEAFGRGDLRARVATSQFSYLGAIENEFNHMADRIQSLIADNKLLGQAVSHNLKTPLARLRFGFDALAEAGDEATREKYAQRIGRDLAEMESLVETLLQYAKLDESNIQLQRQRTELNDFVSHLLADYESAAPQIEYVRSGAALFLDTDPNYLAIMLNNLLSNARNHACARIRVSVLADGGAPGANAKVASITIEDDGPGIPEQERETVLEPFRRGSNSGASRGHGMGLAIVARIARWLDAGVVIGSSATLGGAEVSLQFRLPPADG